MIQPARVFLFLALLPGAALSDMISDEGMAPYEVCALCHGLDGISAMAKFPKLAGQPAAYIEKQIHDFLNGDRTNDGGQMVSIVSELTPDELPVVAEWFSSQPAPDPEGEGSPEGMALLADLGCLACHDEADKAPEVPYLSAQHENYLIKQMTDYRDGARSNDPDGAMQAAMAGVDDAQIAAMAAALSATQRGK